MSGAKLSNRLRPGFIRTAVLAGAAMFASVGSQAQAANSTQDSEAVVVTPLSFLEVNDLKFGTIVPSSTSDGTVTLASNGTRTATNGIVLIGSAHQTAEFAGQGTQNQIVDIAIGANSILLTGPGPAMQVSQFQIGSTPTTILTTNPRFFRIGSPTGIFRFPIGAVLEVAQNQPAGTYSGTWEITLNYN